MHPDASPDAAVDPREDAAPPPVPETTTLWTVRLLEGGTFSGEHIATYDQNRWWDSSPTLTHAVFDIDRLLPYPDDASITLVDQADIASISIADVTIPSYRQALRDRGIVLGRPPLDGVNLVFTSHDSYHLEENGYGDFAWDFVRTDTQGTRYTGDGLRNEDYLVWDAPVYLPTSGYVVEVVRDGTDNEPGTYPEDAINNMVGVHLDGSYYLYLLHFRAGSIPDGIQEDVYLDAGTFLGTVGNSGVSLEPHLHVTVLWYDAGAQPPRSWSVPAEFRDVWAGPSPAGPSTLHPFLDPGTGVYIAPTAF